MSFIQWDLGADPKAKAVASIGHIKHSQAVGGLIQMWTWCWRQRSINVDPALIGPFFDVADDESAVIKGLMVAGFVEKEPSSSGDLVIKDEKDRLGLRKTLARQAGAAKARAHKEKAIKAPSSADQAPINVDQPLIEAKKGHDQGPIKVDQGHQEPRAIKPRAIDPESSKSLREPEKPPAPAPPPAQPSSLSAGPPVDGTVGALLAKLKSQPEGAHQELIKLMCDASQRFTGQKYGFTSRDGKAVQELLRLGPVPEVVTRWERALTATGYMHCSAIHELVGKWNHHAQAQATPSPQKPPARPPEGIQGSFQPKVPEGLLHEALAILGHDRVPAAELLVDALLQPDMSLPHILPWLTSLGFQPGQVEQVRKWLVGKKPELEQQKAVAS